MIGSGKPGYLDGSFEECQFMSPQGLCVVNDMVYVADSSSHHIRTVSNDWVE